MAHILVVDDEEGIRTFVADSLKRPGHTVTTVRDGQEAIDVMNARGFDLVISDLKMPNVDGMQLLAYAKAQQPELEFIMMTAHGSTQTAIDAMKNGAFDYLQKPLSGPAELRLLVERALERRSLLDLKAQLEPQAGPEEVPLSYGAPAMVPMVAALKKVAATQATVLLLGQSGTGKALCTRRVHQWSQRREAPFIAINCAALTDTLLESTLFGHEKGAFTGAVAKRIGKFEEANGGALFLDEIGELPLEAQVKLLRAIQEGEVDPVGGARTVTSDFRLITATNRDLAAEVGAGRFREDLYYRINGFPIRIPALAERRDEVPMWARHFLDRRLEAIGRRCRYIEERAIFLLSEQDWPGNLRQFSNMIQRAALYAVADQPEGDLILMARHVEQALVQDGQPVKRDLIMALRAAAREFVDIASVERSALSWAHADCFTAFVLTEAIERFGEREAFVKLGQAARLNASNHKKKIRRENEKMFVLLDVLRSDKESRHS